MAAAELPSSVPSPALSPAIAAAACASAAIAAAIAAAAAAAAAAGSAASLVVASPAVAAAPSDSRRCRCRPQNCQPSLAPSWAALTASNSLRAIVTASGLGGGASVSSSASESHASFASSVADGSVPPAEPAVEAVAAEAAEDKSVPRESSRPICELEAISAVRSSESVASPSSSSTGGVRSPCAVQTACGQSSWRVGRVQYSSSCAPTACSEALSAPV